MTGYPFQDREVLTHTTLNAALATAAITGGVIDGAAIGGTTRAAGAFTTLAANGAASLTSTLAVGGTSTLGNTSHNYATLAGAATATAVTFTATGGDTNVPFLLTTKGVGEIRTDRPILASTSSSLTTLSGLRSTYTSFWHHNNITYAGAMAPRFNVSGSLAGTISGSAFDIHAFTVSSDNVDATTSGGLVTLYVGHACGGTTLKGNRTAVTAKMRQTTASPNQSEFRFITGGSFGAYTTTSTGAGVGYGYDESDGYYFGALLQARAETGSRFVKSLQGLELNVGNEELDVPVLDMGGIQVVMETYDSGPWMRQANAYGIGHQTGVFTSVGWNIGFCYQLHNGKFGINRTYGTILGGNRSQYGFAPQCAYGVDFNLVTLTQAAFRGPAGNSLIDGDGNISGQTVGGVALETTSAINAYTAGVSTITVIDGSLILTKPALTLSAPPSGTTAEAEVNTMAAVYMRNLIGGTGYAVNDTVTLVGGTFTTAAVFTVSEVSAGVPTRLTLATAGSYTVLPTGPVATTTSGSGTGLTLNVWWTMLTVTVTVAGDGYPRDLPPVVTAAQSNDGGDYSPLREPKFQVNMSAGTRQTLVLNAGNISFAGLPTSASGLASGRVWNNAGVLTIVA